MTCRDRNGVRAFVVASSIIASRGTVPLAHAQESSVIAPQDAVTKETKLKEAKGEEEPANGFVALPNIFTEPESGVGLGAFGLYFWHAGNPEEVRPSEIRSSVYVTTKEQFFGNFGPTLWLSKNRFKLQPYAQFIYRPEPFFPIGNKSGNSEQFTQRRVGLEMSASMRILKSLYFGLTYQIDWVGILDKQSGGLLATSNVPGRDGGRSSAPGLTLVFDNRDNTYATEHGTYLEIDYLLASTSLGSEYTHHHLSADFRHFVPIGSEVIAFQLFGSLMSGDVPFYSLSNIGGSERLRGVFQGKFTDLNALQGQVDFRFPIFGNLWGAAFLGAGEVMRRLDDFGFDKLHVAGGAGLRYRIVPAEKIGIRLDFAYGEDGLTYYLDVGEAF